MTDGYDAINYAPTNPRGYYQHLEMPVAILTRDGVDRNVHLYNDTIVFDDDGTYITAIQIGDKLTIPRKSVIGYYQSNIGGTWTPDGVTFESYNINVATTSASTDGGGVITPIKTGITYVMATAGNGAFGSFKLNVVPKNESFIAYPRI